MENPIVRRVALSSLPNPRHSREKGRWSEFFVRGERLFPWKLAGLAALSRCLSAYSASHCAWRSGDHVGLSMGSCHSCEKTNFREIDEISPSRGDGEAPRDFWKILTVQNG